MTSLIYECTIYLIDGQIGPVLQLYPQKIVVAYPESWSLEDEDLYFLDNPELRDVVDQDGLWDPDFILAVTEPCSPIENEGLPQ